MKIVHIIEASATGTLSMAALLANTQAGRGHQVYIIYSRRPETPDNLQSFFVDNIQLINIQMHSNIEKLKSLLELASAVRRINPKTVFMHSSFAGFLGRLSGLITSERTQYFYLPHCISFMRKDVGKLKRALFIAFEWLAAIKKCDYVACSESERSEIAKSIPFRKCHVIENAVSFEAKPALTPPIKKAYKTVITVGQIRTQKGPELFAELAASVRSANNNVNFLWIGDGEHKSKQLLENSGVQVAGWMTKEKVLHELSKADLYLSTSKWEGMPVSLIEAAYSGLPVIASDCAGNIDVVTHGETGWLFNDVTQAKSLILSALNDSKLAKALSDAALNKAEERFSIARYSKQMESLINQGGI